MLAAFIIANVLLAAGFLGLFVFSCYQLCVERQIQVYRDVFYRKIPVNVITVLLHGQRSDILVRFSFLLYLCCLCIT